MRKQGERMGMKFACLTSLLLLVGLGSISCSSSNVVAGTGLLYVTTQANQSISVWGINLDDGVISTNNNATPTGNGADAVALTVSAAFVANKQDNTISGYTVNSDGTLAASGSPIAACTNPSSVVACSGPVSMVIDPAGQFLYVANQGEFTDPSSGAISIFSIQNSSLSASGSPVSTATPGVLTGTGPSSLAITTNGNYLYVANQFTNTVSAYAVSSGVLTLVPGSPYTVGTSPSAVTLTPDGTILFVANEGTNNISAFTACTTATLNCVTPDGHLTPVANSPFAAGLAPVAMASDSDSQGEYLYVADYNSSEVSQYKVGTQTGVLTALSPPSVSTGANPTSIVIRAGSSTVLSTGGLAYYVYTSNIGAGTISSFSYDSTTGALGLVGSGATTTTFGGDSSLAVR
jgi:6-phosphogluconolactonase